MVYPIRQSLGLSILVLAQPLLAQVPAPRTPQGIYAKVNISSDISQQQQMYPTLTPAQFAAYLDTYFNSLYQSLLSNPAISGLEIQVHWDQINPNPPASANPYFWNYLDDAFNQAAAWDAQNPARPPKTIMLVMTPGFQSPPWLLAQIPSCDGLFEAQTPASTCGKATFKGYNEPTDGNVLPLPWNPVYQSAWKTFLTALAARYLSNPTFVSIAVTGPTAASPEMALPSNNTTNNPQTQFPTPISPNCMWLRLLAFQYPSLPAYQNTDQAFIDAWDSAIDLYGEIFSGVTLVATTGSGLPNFSPDPTPPSGPLGGDCGNPDMECNAVVTILTYFMEPTVGGANAKASQTSGLEAARVTAVNMGVGAVQRLSQITQQFTSPSAQVLGGVELNTSVSDNTLAEGCTMKFPPNASDPQPGCTAPPAPSPRTALRLTTGIGALPSRASRRLASPQASLRRVWQATRNSARSLRPT